MSVGVWVCICLTLGCVGVCGCVGLYLSDFGLSGRVDLYLTLDSVCVWVCGFVFV